MSIERFRPLEDYQLRLPMFEGPIDVLLRMIERNQLEITAVSLVSVTDQFVAYVTSLAEEVSAEVLADFSTLAARLLALKSRSLLPVPENVTVEPESLDLAARLRAYQALRERASLLEQLNNRGERTYARVTAPTADQDVREHLMPLSPDHIAKAMRRLLARSRQKADSYATPPVISLGTMVQRLLRRLPGNAAARFADVVGRQAPRSERIVGFIALLTLVRRNLVVARQAAMFGEIEIEKLEATSGVDYER